MSIPQTKKKMFNRKEYNKRYGKKYRAEHSIALRAYNLNYKKKKKEALKKERKVWASKNKKRISSVVRANKLKVRYGLTPEEYEKLSTKQLKKCAICGAGKKLDVDHCHKTKRIRGLLCGNCNRGLGLFKDDPNILQNAIKYLSPL